MTSKTPIIEFHLNHVIHCISIRHIVSAILGGGGGGGKVNSAKKGMFLRIFFDDTDSVRLFSQFPCNNATFEQYFPKFSLQNIENCARMTVNLRRRLEKSCFAVYIITRNRII